MSHTVRRTLLRLSVGTLALVAVACKDDDAVEVRGDVPDLDASAQRGDSLVASLEQPSTIMDSLRVDAAARFRVAMDSALVAEQGGARAETEPRSGAGMTARARARGDSAARAELRRMVSASEPTRRPNADTARGVVTLIGSAAVPQLVLMADGGQREISLSGMATSGLSKLVGLDVLVRGFLVSPNDVVVFDYIVRSAKGLPAFDGVLTQRGGGWALVLTDGGGVKPLSGVPPTLRAAAGARVWVSVQPQSATPVSYGLVAR